jgi:hypothetical protein
MCKEHPRYKAVNRPNTNCNECWQQYCDTHDMNWVELLKSLQKYGKNAMKAEESYVKAKKFQASS